MDYIKNILTDKELRLCFLRDELVFNVSSFMLDYIERLIHQTQMKRLVLDITHVNHIDSSAVGLFIALKNEMMKRDIGFSLEGVNENVQRILRLLDVTKFLDAA